MFSHIRMKILLIVIPVLCGVIMLSYIASVSIAKRIIDQETSERISAEKEIQKNLIEKNIYDAAQISGVLAAFAEKNYKYNTPEDIINNLETTVTDNAFILGAGIWFEPYLYNQSQKYMGPLYIRRVTISYPPLITAMRDMIIFPRTIIHLRN